MNHKELHYFKDLLTRWLDDLLGRAGNTVAGLIDAKDPLSDPLDRAVFDAERGYTLRIRSRESVLIKKIRASLDDIEDGVYGICDDCGRDIAIERLRARPVARRCIRCKTRQENRERLTRAS
ncbi:MAG: RNA polymerase-binding protein DksA [Desulfobacterales bacterium]|jgi:DnaK suppressor protein